MNLRDAERVVELIEKYKLVCKEFADWEEANGIVEVSFIYVIKRPGCVGEQNYIKSLGFSDIGNFLKEKRDDIIGDLLKMGVDVLEVEQDG